MHATPISPRPARAFWQLTALVDAHGSDGHPYTVLAQTEHTDDRTGTPTRLLLTGDGQLLDRLTTGQYRIRQSDITLVSDDLGAP